MINPPLSSRPLVLDRYRGQVGCKGEICPRICPGSLINGVLLLILIAFTADKDVRGLGAPSFAEDVALFTLKSYNKEPCFSPPSFLSLSLL